MCELVEPFIIPWIICLLLFCPKYLAKLGIAGKAIIVATWKITKMSHMVIMNAQKNQTNNLVKHAAVKED